MKKIGINFAEKTLLILTDSQQGTETVLDVDLDIAKSFAPENVRTRSCLLWNFEDHTCTVCEDYLLPQSDREEGCIITEECFVPRQELTFSCDADFESFMAALGYKAENIREEIDSLLAQLLMG